MGRKSRHRSVGEGEKYCMHRSVCEYTASRESEKERHTKRREIQLIRTGRSLDKRHATVPLVLKPLDYLLQYLFAVTNSYRGWSLTGLSLFLLVSTSISLSRPYSLSGKLKMVGASLMPGTKASISVSCQYLHDRAYNKLYILVRERERRGDGGIKRKTFGKWDALLEHFEPLLAEPQIVKQSYQNVTTTTTTTTESAVML